MTDLAASARALTDTELIELRAIINAEQGLRSERAERQREYETWLASAETLAELSGEVAFTPVPHFGHLPGQVVTYEDGRWRNVSGAYLTASPADYPLGWARIIPEDEADTVPSWVEGETVQAGDLRAFDGAVYAAIQPHTTQAGWQPPAVPALWVAQETTA